jgi:DNA-binding XRE family transcriptional regulator
MTGTNSTTSNVVYQAEILDSRGYEANDTSERENVRRRFCLAQKGSRQTLAGCRYNQLGHSPSFGSNRSEGHSGSAQEIAMPLGKSGRRHGWTQVEFAERVGIDRSFLADVERGKRNVSILNVELAKGLNVSLSRLLSRI